MKRIKQYLAVNLALVMLLALFCGTVFAATDTPLKYGEEDFIAVGEEKYSYSFRELEYWPDDAELVTFRVSTTFGDLKVYDEQERELPAMKYEVEDTCLEVTVPMPGDREYRVTYTSDPLINGRTVKIAATAADCVTILGESYPVEKTVYGSMGFYGSNGLFYRFTPTKDDVYSFTASTAAEVNFYNAKLTHLSGDTAGANRSVKQYLKGGQTYYISLYRQNGTAGIEKIIAVVQPTGHQHAYSETIVMPTCTEQGYTKCTCSCGDTFQKDVTSAFGHDWDSGVISVKPSFNENGEMRYTCKRCGETETKIIPPMRENPFTDVKDGLYYTEPVLWAVANEITAGTTATTFSPDDGCTRAQVVTFLWRAAGKPQPSSAKNAFKDVKQGQYYYEAVLWAVENGITNGTSAETFSPDATCTRAQIVTFLWRYENEPTPTAARCPFNDVKSDTYYERAVLWAVEKGVTNGTSATSFGPEDTCTRAQIVSFLYRDAQKSVTGQ